MRTSCRRPSTPGSASPSLSRSRRFSRVEREAIARDAALHSLVSFDVYALESGPGDVLGIPTLAPLAGRTETGAR